MTSLVWGTQLFGGLPGSESSCQFQMLATVHIEQLRPQHRCQQCEWASGGGHAVQRVIHAVVYHYQLLHGSMGPGVEILQSLCSPFPSVRTTYLSSSHNAWNTLELVSIFKVLNQLCKLYHPLPCAWSMGIAEKTRLVFWMVKLPALNSQQFATSGCRVGSSVMSRRWTGIQWT